MKKILLSVALFGFLLGNAQMNYSFEGGTAAAHIAVVTTKQAKPGTQSFYNIYSGRE